MSPDGAHQAEGDHRHDDERLPVGTQRDRQQRIDEDKRERVVARQRTGGLALLALFALQAVGEARDGRQQPGQGVRFDVGQDRVGIRDLRIHVTGHVDHALAVGSADVREAASAAGAGNAVEWHLAAFRRADS